VKRRTSHADAVPRGRGNPAITETPDRQQSRKRLMA